MAGRASWAKGCLRAGWTAGSRGARRPGVTTGWLGGRGAGCAQAAPEAPVRPGPPRSPRSAPVLPSPRSPRSSPVAPVLPGRRENPAAYPGAHGFRGARRAGRASGFLPDAAAAGLSGRIWPSGSIRYPPGAPILPEGPILPVISRAWGREGHRGGRGEEGGERRGGAGGERFRIGGRGCRLADCGRPEAGGRRPEALIGVREAGGRRRSWGSVRPEAGGTHGGP